MEEYGTRLFGHSIKINNKGRKLYGCVQGKDYRIGMIKSQSMITHGPVKITLWEMDDGKKYYYM